MLLVAIEFFLYIQVAVKVLRVHSQDENVRAKIQKVRIEGPDSCSHDLIDVFPAFA